MYNSMDESFSWESCCAWMSGVMRDVSLAWPAERTVKARRRALMRERRDERDIVNNWWEEPIDCTCLRLDV